MSETLEKVIKLISEQLNIPAEQITEDKEIVKDLGADSLDIVEMIIELENTFGVSVSNEDTSNIVTVGDIVKLIDKK